MTKDKKDWRAKNRPYIVAFVLAFVMTMLVAPEMMEGDSMKPVLKDGQAVCVVKASYSAKRGLPELGSIAVMEKVFSKEYAEDNIIGRVAGLPGDSVKAFEGTLYINDEAVGNCRAELDYIIDDDSIFLLADNTADKAAVDSRTIGPVPMKEIKGDARFIIWPLKDIGGIK